MLLDLKLHSKVSPKRLTPGQNEQVALPTMSVVNLLVGVQDMEGFENSYKSNCLF